MPKHDGSAERPEFCPWIYKDMENLYLEFEGCTLRFPLTEGGAAKLLAHVPNVVTQRGFLSGGQNIADRLLRGKIIQKTRKAPKLGPSVTGAAKLVEGLDPRLYGGPKGRKK